MNATVRRWRGTVVLLALTALSACASSFFKISPEDGSDRPATKPVEKPAEKPPKPREEPKTPVVKKPAEKAPPVTTPPAQVEKPVTQSEPKKSEPKNEPKKVEPAKQNPTATTAAATPPVAPPIARRPEPVVEAPSIEPTAAGSDSAGIARLMRAAALWDAVRLFHPTAVGNTEDWNLASVRRFTDIRIANTRQQYLATLQRWLSSLSDAVTTAQSLVGEPGNTNASTATGTSGQISSEMQVVTTGSRKSRVTDTTLILTWPRALTLVDTAGWSSLRSTLTNSEGANQIVIDLRGARYVPTRIWNDSALRSLQRDVASLLTSLTLAGPSIRRRAYDGWADERAIGTPSSTGGLWRTSDPLVVVKGRATPQPRRVVLVADATTEMAPALMALVSNKQATLISEAPLSDRLLVPVTNISMGDDVQATVRTGELINVDGSTGFEPDTIVSPAAPNDSAPVIRTALLVARGKLEVGSQTARHLANASAGARANAVVTDASWNAEHYPIMGARLLGLFKLWGTLRAFHAYNDLRDENIDDALYRIIPRVEAATEAYSSAAAMLDFAAATNDNQAQLSSPTLDQYLGAATAPFRVRMVDGRAIVTQVAATDAGRASGLVVGEEIMAADGYPIPAYVNERRRYAAASNDWARLRNTMDMVPRGAPGNALYRVRDASGRERSITIERTADNTRVPLANERSIYPVVRDLGGGIGYVDLLRATVQDVYRATAISEASRAVIIDARGAVDARADGYLPAELQMTLQRTSSLFNATVGKQTLRLASEPCLPAMSQFLFSTCMVERRQTDEMVASDTAARYRGRVVILIDERTEGPMEQFAMAMETAANATLIGSASAGAVGKITAVRAPGLLTLTFSNTELRRADGGQLQRVGLSPQVDARPTVRGIRAGTDEVLDRAQAWLKEQLDPPVRRRR